MDGEMTSADGILYEGDWKNGKLHGEGKMTYANGNVYDGIGGMIRSMEKGNIHLMDIGRMTRGMEKEYLLRMLMESCMMDI